MVPCGVRETGKIWWWQDEPREEEEQQGEQQQALRLEEERRNVSERPIYVSFVSKAILWERGLCHYTDHTLCPRFLSHMKARPEDLRPPCLPSTKSRTKTPPQGRTLNARALPALGTPPLAGYSPLNPVRRRNVAQSKGSATGRRSAVAVPCLPLPATPPPSSINPTPPLQNCLHLDSGRKERRQSPVPASPSYSRPAPEEKDGSQKREEAPRAADVASVAEPGWEQQLGPAGSEHSAATTPLSQGSLSDLSRPPSSLLSGCTNLTSGRSSVMSEIRDSGPGDSSWSFQPQPSPVMQLPHESDHPAGADPHQSSTFTASTLLLHKPLLGQTTPLSSRPTSGLQPISDQPLSSSKNTKEAEDFSLNALVDHGLNPSLDSDLGLVALAFLSATWSSCPSPQGTTPRSGSGAKLTPSPPVSRPGSHCWPVLPPISPVRGRCGTTASRYSELSCSRSRVFDELEAIAPRSASCPSLDRASDSSGCPSPDTELSPGLAALTVGCHSGNLGSLSRVQLLLLDRQEPETLPSPCGLEEDFLPVQDWTFLRMQYNPGLTSEGVSRPLTAGSISERCDSTGKVMENKSDWSEGGSGSPSSWIIDPSPSYRMFGSSHSPCPSNQNPSADEGGPFEGESNYPGWRDQVVSSSRGRSPEGLEHRMEEEEIRMEERKTKVLNMLSKLQEDAPHKNKSSKGCSNFEDFNFLAKYCIFSQEKLDEYKRAFEAEDCDSDGYISCLQVLLALKSIIPPELLSEEEEIYVYRILEMVDFRVTDGLVDLRLFAVIASLAQKVATMDDFMRSLISSMDFRSLEVRLFKAKQLFLFLLEETRGDAGARGGFISAEQLLLELKAGGIHLEQEAAIRLELQRIPPLDLLDFLAYLPLFMLIHKSVISNPLSDSGDL